jgi:hypothetical protein
MSDIISKVVFFAEVSDEMSEYKENLIKELNHLGCSVKTVKKSEVKNEKIREIIAHCDAAVHILSDHDFGLQPSGKGFEELQINFSVRHFLGSRLLTDQPESVFKIFAWHKRTSGGNIFVEEHLSNHLKKIQQLDEVDFVRSNFENFKSYLVGQIKNYESDEAQEFYIKGSKNYNVYFLHDQSDREKAEKYIDYLNQRGFKVLTPDFDSDIISSRQTHENYLRKFDIAMIYAENAGTNWINMKVMDILKAPGLGRDKEITGSIILTSDSLVSSIHLVKRRFAITSTDSGTVKSQIDEILQKLMA